MSVFSTARIDVFFNKADALKGINELREKTRSSASDIKKSFMGAFGTLGATVLGAKAFKSVYDNSLKIVDLADKWGQPIEGISQFANEMALLGGSTEDAMNTVDSLQQAITDLRTTGGGSLKEVSAQIGANLYNANGEVKNYKEMLDEIRQKFKNIKDDATRTKVAQELGLTSPAQLRYLKMSDAEYSKINKEAKRNGTLNSKNAQQLKDFRASITKLKMSFASLAGEIMNDVKPAVDLISKGFKWLSESPAWVRKLIVAFAGFKVLNSFVGITDKIKGLFDFLKGVGNVGLGGLSKLLNLFKGLALVSWKGISTGIGLISKALMGLATNPVFLTIAGIVAGLYSLYKLYEKYQANQEDIKKQDEIFDKMGVDRPKNFLDENAELLGIEKPKISKPEDYIEKLNSLKQGEDYTKLGGMSKIPQNEMSQYPRSSLAQSTINNNKSINMTINMKSTDPKESAMEFQNILNSQLAEGVI